jgi:hypothetical protein
MKRVMWIERKTSDGLFGPARIGWVKVVDKGKRLEYGDKVFRTLAGSGFKANYYDIETGEQYWTSGCRKDGMNALYGTIVEIDDDALQEYWVRIRNRPQDKNIRNFKSVGKYKR